VVQEVQTDAETQAEKLKGKGKIIGYRVMMSKSLKNMLT